VAARIARVSTSLPADTLRAADRERRETRESRSEFFRRAVDALIQRRREREEIDRYVASYVAEPAAPRRATTAAPRRALATRRPRPYFIAE
jgi:metal-responsive CopG/Arc/MetJ family transcriptional regulator